MKKKRFMWDSQYRMKRRVMTTAGTCAAPLYATHAAMQKGRALAARPEKIDQSAFGYMPETTRLGTGLAIA